MLLRAGSIATLLLLSACSSAPMESHPDAGPPPPAPDAGAFPSCGMPGTDHATFGGALNAAAGTTLEGTLTLMITLGATGQAAVSGGFTARSPGEHSVSGTLEGFVDCATGALRPCAGRPSASGLCASLSAPGRVDQLGVLDGTLIASVGSGNWAFNGSAPVDGGVVEVHGHGSWIAQ